MKKTTSVLTLLLLIFAVYWSFKALMPTYSPDATSSDNSFSTDRALTHIKEISKEPHAVGFKGHQQVRTYIVNELEKLGLETTIQEGYTAGDWANLCKATNILAKVKGTTNGKALMLMSHYDSNPHSSFGASDAGSGVATILEGLRAFLAANEQPKNDIIVLITDAEELGLNGAQLFVKEHEWAKDVGLILNFEARGSGGPSFMLMETNRGNANLIKEFIKANPEYPVATSLAYSVYKMLPNDTDLTVFREDADIEGFNFAFIDDHYDYHTALDTYDRLDRNTLAHQGSYLMPLLSHFSQSDLGQLKSLSDYVYFNVPFFKMVSYPFGWIWPMLLLAFILFLATLIIGFKKKVLNGKDIFKGFVPLLFSLLINGIVGFYAWRSLKWLYPEYKDMLHGFTYNGHAYIFAFAFFAMGICFYAYHKFKVVKTPNLLVAPIFIWLVICTLVNEYLSGAAFFIVPVLAMLVAFYISVHQKNPNAFLLVFLGIPAIFILAPFVKMFPVGLGLKMMVTATLFTTLIFFLLLPIFTRFRNKRGLAIFSFLLCVGFMVAAHMNSDFTETSPKPTSLLYVLDTDSQTANWATYDQKLSDWTAQYIGDDKTDPAALSNKTISSKYGSGFSYIAEAPLKEIAKPLIEVSKDTVINGNRQLEICITPKRNINRLEIFNNQIDIKKATVNGVALSEYYLSQRGRKKLITHYVSDNAYTELELEIDEKADLELTIYEASNDLLENNLFSIPQRPADNIPMPFVLNDAILTIQKLTFD
ncbi:M20/M25/M40 family metallo-hydrolase [Maribacter sp. 2210JD10-5]|uniref:M20/M25/M40 family metallo-hydrolase n=1 Tax=Maribacter sp. 2210JD10-5 TaxID=3386272 RepID=UPI0039BCEB48